jgi:hypothetical protein
MAQPEQIHLRKDNETMTPEMNLSSAAPQTAPTTPITNPSQGKPAVATPPSTILPKPILPITTPATATLPKGDATHGSQGVVTPANVPSPAKDASCSTSKSDCSTDGKADGGGHSAEKQTH